MSATLRERAEHAAKYGANLIVAATEIKAILDERDTLSAAHEAVEAERDLERSRVERYIGAHRNISDQLVAIRAEKDAAVQVMSNHRCDESAERAHRRAVKAEAERGAALASIERVRDVLSAPSWGAVSADDIRRALDGGTER